MKYSILYYFFYHWVQKWIFILPEHFYKVLKILFLQRNSWAFPCNPYHRNHIFQRSNNDLTRSGHTRIVLCHPFLKSKISNIILQFWFQLINLFWIKFHPFLYFIYHLYIATINKYWVEKKVIANFTYKLKSLKNINKIY